MIDTTSIQTERKPELLGLLNWKMKPPQLNKIANIRIRKGLKYKIPSISQVKTGKLTDEQIEFLRKNLDDEKMDDEISEFWEHYLT